jgi:Kef-type K+ transport system membrane component KefB
MPVADILLELLLILVAARIVGDIAVYFGAPAVIGELSAGILIGPSVFGWVEMNEIIKLLGEIGVILLLFDVGLETDFKRLASSGRKSLIVAMGGFIAPLICCYLVSFYIFDLSMLTSLFVGGALTATSIGITLRTLSDIGRHQSSEGQIVLGAAVLDDILGVILLALLYDLSISGSLSIESAAKVFLFVGLFFMLAPILAHIFSVLIQKEDQRIVDPSLIPTMIFALILFFAWLAHLFGVPELLGGFAAGMALSRRFFMPFGIALHNDPAFSKKIGEQIRPVVQIFTPIFFVSIGLSLDLRSVDWSSPFFWKFSLALALIAIITKFAGAMLITEPWVKRMIIGMSMAPRGEVGLIFAGLGASAGIFTTDVYTALIVVIAYTTLISPYWIKLYYRKYGKQIDSKSRTTEIPPVQPSPD